eukprot:TRINITY_DN74317_c0_g1_i1.p1 TRINITY_DN74317_c0_g1~~TRINITY_DN74317_c0_g1_i1.p1  ORF type:complete len:314 (-),score=74.72 TRINITY_DN74317_c0_g1_i1:281-1222(-)
MVGWGIFVTAVHVPGAIVVASLLSSVPIFMKIGSMAMTTPVKIHTMRFNLGSFMLSLCLVLFALTFSSLKSHEARLENVKKQSVATAEGERNVHLAARNMYITMLGVVLWATAWRLDGLYKSGALKLGDGKKGSMPVWKRVAFFALALVFAVVADVPLCRLNYNFQLLMSITPVKERLLASAGPCRDTYLMTAPEGCADFCAQARTLSQDRQFFIHWARSWHPMGKVAAELFDGARDVQQDESRIEELFHKKTCGEVLKSVDKSNWGVNTLCVVLSSVAVLGVLWAGSNAILGDEEAAPAPKVAEPGAKEHSN